MSSYRANPFAHIGSHAQPAKSIDKPRNVTRLARGRGNRQSRRLDDYKSIDDRVRR